MTIIETQLKQLMEYKTPDTSCRHCKSFVDCDVSGSAAAKGSHCTLNPAVDLPVDPAGFCKFFKEK